MASLIEQPRKDLRTVTAVHAERNRLLQEVRSLDVVTQTILGKSDVLTTFKNASLQDSSNSFSFGNLEGQFKGKYGITDADLKLKKDEVNALNPADQNEGKKKEALQLKLALEELAKEIAAKQQKGLWQQHILFESLLGDNDRTGIRNGEHISLDDLTHLNSVRANALKVFDQKNLPASVLSVTYSQGKPSFKMSKSSTPADVRQVIDVIAAAGNQTVSIDCKKPEDLGIYQKMIEESFMSIIDNGYDLKMTVNPPHFVSHPGSVLNKRGEPFRRQDSFRRGKSLAEFGEAIAAKMPAGIAAAADKGARLGMTYENLSAQHKEMFVKMIGSRPNAREYIEEMASYFVRSGQLDKLREFQNHVAQTLKQDMRDLVDRVVHDQVRSTMNMDEMNVALDRGFDHTQASRHYESLAVTPVSSSRLDLVDQMISAMSVLQLKNYAEHLARHQDMPQLDSRVGMVLAHVNNNHREAFIKDYLTEVHKNSCKKHGVKPGEIPATTPPAVAQTVNDRTESYKSVQEDVQNAATALLTGVNDYTKRLGVPNQAALDASLTGAQSVIQDLAQQDVADIAAVYPTAGIGLAERTGYAQAAANGFNNTPTVTSCAAAQEAARGEFARSARPAPHTR